MYVIHEELRRDRAKKLFAEYLQDDKFSLTPVSIRVDESKESKTNVSFEVLENSSLTTVESCSGSGFVDAIFAACLEKYSEEYVFLDRIKLTDFRVQPTFNFGSKSRQTDAKTDVVLTVEVSNKGPAQFIHNSESIVFSGFATVISIFEFYINCGLSYNRLKFLIKEANSRYRGDLVSKYKHDISHLVELGAHV